MTGERDTSALTAQVILRTAQAGDTGETAGRILPPTSASRTLPDRAEAHKVQEFFRAAGFDVGDVFGTSFSLIGPIDAFVATFGTDQAVLEPILRGESGAAQLNLSEVPDEVRQGIEAVVVTATPDFGPTNP
jgi:hypothetical protein